MLRSVDGVNSEHVQNQNVNANIYADKDIGQVMFTVDNTSEGDEDFKSIRSKVHSLITGREEFSIEYPISYLLFCLELQNLK